MNNRMTNILLAIFLVIFSFHTNHICCGGKKVLKLGTASIDGNYYPLGDSIKVIVDSCNSCNDEFEILVVPTKGSVDNIERLVLPPDSLSFIELIDTTKGSNDTTKIQQIDLAIVQNDIAYYAENDISRIYPDSTVKENIKELRGILTFYPEPIYIITNDPEIQFADQLKYKKINVGMEGSGLNINAKIILNSIGLWDTIIKHNFRYAGVDSLKTYLNTNVFDASFMNNINEDVQCEINQDSLTIIYLSPNDIMNMVNTYKKRFSPFPSVESPKTVAVKSILICKNKSVEVSTISKFSEIIYSNYQKLDFPDDVKKEICQYKNQLLEQMPLKHWHEGAKKYFCDLSESAADDSIEKGFKAIIDPPLTKRLLNMAPNGLIIFITALISLYILNIAKFFCSDKFLRKATKSDTSIGLHKKIFIHILHKMGIRNNRCNNYFCKIIDILSKINLKVIKHKYLLLLSVILTLNAIITISILFFEHSWAIKNYNISVYDTMPFSKRYLWTFVYVCSGYYQNIFPNSTISRLLLSLYRFAGLGGIISIIVFSTSDKIKKRIYKTKGAQVTMIKNHIIICGWNENVPFIINNLLHKNVSTHKQIVVLADSGYESPFDNSDFNPLEVFFVKGDASKSIDLDRANIKEAVIVVIVADSKSSDTDAENILKLHTVTDYCRKLYDDKIREHEKIQIIAEIKDIRKREIAQKISIKETIILEQIEKKLLVQAVKNPGIYEVIDEILTYNDYNDIYSILLDENNTKLHKKIFDDLLAKLRKDKIQLIAINREKTLKKNEEKKINENALTRAIITNPIDKNENDYNTKAGDILIVLAQNEEVINKALIKYE